MVYRHLWTIRDNASQLPPITSSVTRSMISIPGADSIPPNLNCDRRGAEESAICKLTISVETLKYQDQVPALSAYLAVNMPSLVDGAGKGRDFR